MMNSFARRNAIAVAAWLWLLPALCFHAEAQDVANTNQPSAAQDQAGAATQEELRSSYLRVQEQLQGLQLKFEESRKDTASAAERNAGLISVRLQGIEQSLAAQRNRELEQMQSSNRAMLIGAGIFGGFGFLAMVVMAFLQWRTINRLSEITAMAPATHLLGPGVGLNGGERLLDAGGAERARLRLTSSLQQLEKRILELESENTRAFTNGKSEPAAGAQTAGGATRKDQDSGADEGSGDADRVAFLLGRGQTLLSLGKPEEALESFEEVLSMGPEHAEALVKRGIALEQLGRSEEALQSYDRAIGADATLTMAYLYKGGLFNRMERHTQALECYEQALRTQNQVRK